MNWVVQEESQFIPYQGQATNTVYFWILANQNKGNTLTIAARHPFSVFVDSKLIWQGDKPAQFSIDSLARKYSPKLFVGVHSNAGFENMTTHIQTYKPMDDTPEKSLRKGNYFLDFALLASLALAISFTIFLRTNLVLTKDYFSINRWLGSQDRTEAGFGLRIASSVNILYYFFGSCLLALILLAAFHLMGSSTFLASIFQINSTSQGFLKWALLSVSIFALLAVKLLWIAIFATLFGFKDTVRFQFFNFVRVIFISVAILVVIGFLFVLFNVRSELFYYYQMYLLAGIFIAGTLVVYFKLMARLPYHFFHLFSYLCASEIIPLIVLVKMILY